MESKNKLHPAGQYRAAAVQPVRVGPQKICPVRTIANKKRREKEQSQTEHSLYKEEKQKRC